jgi:toxin ParE1/3/4
MPVVFTRVARQDLLGIALRIAERNPVRALTYVDELEAHCESIAILPGAGSQRPEWGDGVLARYYGKCVIAFRVRDGAVQILRVIHGARNLDAEFAADPMAE